MKEILKVANTCTLSNAAVTGATKYHFRVSRDYDFTVVDYENNTLNVPVYTATLTAGSGPEDKYYWQWREYISSWQPWHEVQSFERLAGGADLTVTDTKWMMFEASERATYTLVFGSAPNYSYTEEQLWREGERNLAGEILSEFKTTKGRIHLEFGADNTISAAEKTQIMRYYGMNNLNVYLACAPINDNGGDYYRKLWKVWFTSSPEVKPLSGNETRFQMTIDLEER